MAEKLFFTATIQPAPDQEARSIALIGREAWAMLELVEAGTKGCTPIDNPAHCGGTIEDIEQIARSVAAFDQDSDGGATALIISG